MADEQAITTEQTQPKSTTTFGVNALNLPTPNNIKTVFKMITFFTIVVGLVCNGISDIPEPLKKQILEYMGVLILILQKAEDFWGIKTN